MLLHCPICGVGVLGHRPDAEYVCGGYPTSGGVVPPMVAGNMLAVARELPGRYISGCGATIPGTQVEDMIAREHRSEAHTSMLGKLQHAPDTRDRIAKLVGELITRWLAESVPVVVPVRQWKRVRVFRRRELVTVGDAEICRAWPVGQLTLTQTALKEKGPLAVCANGSFVHVSNRQPTVVMTPDMQPMTYATEPTGFPPLGYTYEALADAYRHRAGAEPPF